MTKDKASKVPLPECFGDAPDDDDCAAECSFYEECKIEWEGPEEKDGGQ